MSDYDADSRDAAYLACQLQTNGVVMNMKARMIKARAQLPEVLLEVLEEAAIPLDIVDIQVPRIDTTVSRLRHRDSSREMPAVTSIPPPLRAR
jgi:uncharacterized protein YqfA (UPF0365 family)